MGTTIINFTDDGATVLDAPGAGPPGPGVPVGGSTGQSLTKASGADYDTQWSTPAGGGDMVAATYDPQAIAADAFDRANHTGAQAIASVNGLQTALDSKLTPVDIDALAKLNAIVADATLIDTGDSRLSDARTPTAHAASHQAGGDDAIKLDDLAAPDDNTDLDASGAAHGLMPKADKTKLDGIEAGATADQTGAEIAAAIDIQNTATRTAFESGDKLLIWEAGVGNRQIDFDDLPAGGGGSSPLTTKGDLYGYSTADARLPVGADGEMLYADSGEATGLRWDAPPSGSGDVAGPASSVDDELVLFSGTSGKVVKRGIGTGIVTLVSGVVSVLARLATLAALPQIATARFLGRNTAGTGDIEELTDATVRSMINVEDGANNYTHPNHTGDVTSTGDGATVIANNAVTNAKADDMAQDRIKGRVTSGTGDPEDLTGAQVRALINVEDGATADQTGAEIAAAIDIENTTPRTAFAAGDKLIIWENGAGNRQIDYSDLPGSGGGLSNIVEDTTPQLGGDLDMNGNNITAAGPTTISPTEMSYLDGVTSAIQTQIDAKIGAAGVTYEQLNSNGDVGTGAGQLTPGDTHAAHAAATAAHGATGAVVGTTNAQTLTNKTLTTPTIADFSNAAHNHTNAAGGGQLSITGATTGTLTTIRGGTGLTTVPANTALLATATDVITAAAFAASTIFARRATGNVGAQTYANMRADLTTVTNQTRSTGYAIVAADNTNGVNGPMNIFTGTTNTVNVNTGLGTYAAAPLIFLLWNQGSGGLTIAGTATVNVPSGKTAVVTAGGMAMLVQSATNVFTAEGNLVAS